MHKINYNWGLALHIRSFTVCMQKILTVPKVAWVNLLPWTWANTGWPCFCHLVSWCFVLLPGAVFFFLTHHRCFLCFSSPTDSTNNLLVRRYMFLPCKKTNQRRAAELVTCFLDRSKMLFLQLWQEACPSDLAGAEREPRFHVDLICPQVVFFLFPSATF